MSVIMHNLMSMNTQRQFKINNRNKMKSSEKLSSGYKINRSSDDAAGLQISEKMRCQIRGLDRASDNAQDGISLIQTAEGGLNEMHEILQRINELAVQAANDTNTTEEREAIQDEINQLTVELDRISDSTKFNNMHVLDATKLIGGDGGAVNQPYTGSMQNEAILHLQVGGTTGESLDYTVRSINAETLGLTDLDVMSHETAGDTMEKAQDAINSVSEYRSYLGACQNRLEHTIAVNDNTADNTQASESVIRDADMATEMMEYSKHSILEQAGQSMLTQANQSSQAVLSLLQ